MKKTILEFSKVLITPAYAKKLLESNTSNRRLKTRKVAQYAEDMAAGRWKEDTGETIKISKTGRILDGQNRLHAIIKSGIAVYMHIVTNLEEEVFDVIDTGAVRSANDVFKIKDIKYETVLPAIIQFYNQLSNGSKLSDDSRVTNSVLLNQYYENEIFWQNITKQSMSWYLAFAKILPPTYIGGFHAYFYGLNKDKATEFMSQLTTGIGITNPTILVLRNKLIQDKLSNKKILPRIKVAYIIKAWNFFIKNQSVKYLRFDLERDDYPVALSVNSSKDYQIDFNDL
jgi:hypothetical protein